MDIISSETVEMEKMEMGLFYEIVDAGTLRCTFDVRSCPSLRRRPDLSERYRRATRGFREVPLAADQPLEDKGSRQLHAGGARRLRLGERAGAHLPEGDSPGPGRAPVSGRLR